MLCALHNLLKLLLKYPFWFLNSYLELQRPLLDDFNKDVNG